MSRFEDEFLQKLKTETDIVRLIESYGTKLKPRGGSDEMIGLCPIHNDKDPSLVVNRKKNLWNCLGACGKGGDPIQWIMHAENASFRHAVELLKDDAVGSNGGKKFTTNRKLENPLTDGQSDQKLLGRVAEYYHSRLKESPQALTYLQNRGITNSEIIDRFKIGFVDRTLGLRLPFKQVKAGKEIREKLKNIGILRDTGHEHLRGCLTFPLFDKEKQVVQIYGRRLDDGQGKTSRHFYLPGPHRGIFNDSALGAHKEIILCESVIDALTFFSAGFRNVTTIYGTNGLTDDLIEGFKKHGTERLLIAFDNDEAGNKAVEKHCPAFEKLGMEIFRIGFPAGMDANEYSLKLTPANQSLGLVIRKAQWISGSSPSNKPTTIPTNQSAPKPEAAKEKKSVTPEDKQPSSLAAKSDDDSSVDDSKEELVAASPLPTSSSEVEVKIESGQITLEIGNRSYRVRGLEKNLAFDVMKLNVMARCGEKFYIDSFDLYAAKARGVFVKDVSQELGFVPEVIKRDLGKVLLKLESLQEQQIQETLSPKDEKVKLSDPERQAALDLLKDPNLVEKILSDFSSCGVVGEETNKLVGYLAATSRKLEKPLAVVIQSSSAAGKSSLMDAILRFIPEEEQVGYSAMTGQSLFYMGGMNLKNKILSIAEEEGVAQASYALKLLQSEGELTIASTGKDPGTGRMETQEYHVEGPVMIFLTTTAIDIDEELLNRCIVLSVDENRQQTRAIQQQQRDNETLDGIIAAKRRSSIITLHKNAQRLLRPLHVVNPYAKDLKFIDDQARRRRDHMKYLSLIRSIALLHQYQRTVKTLKLEEQTIQYVEVIPSDIVLANRLANHVLGNSIDELPPQTRRLLVELFDWVASECKRLNLERTEFHFTRRNVRESLGWNQTQLSVHFRRLTEMDYLLVRRGGKGSTLVYELLWDGRGREGESMLCGLLDAGKLTSMTTNLSGRKSNLSVSNRGGIGGVPGPSKNGKPRPAKDLV